MPNTKIGLLFCLMRFSVQDKSLVLLTQGLGKQPFHGRVVVLVNEWTNSAGEIAAQFAKDTRLATVIRQSDQRQCPWVDDVRRRAQLPALFANIRLVQSQRKLHRSSGVLPDVTVDIDPDRLAYGDDSQVKKALDYSDNRRGSALIHPAD